MGVNASKLGVHLSNPLWQPVNNYFWKSTIILESALISKSRSSQGFFLMRPNTATIPQIFLPQLTWKASSPLSLTVTSRTSRIWPSSKGLTPWDKLNSCSISSKACWIPHRQGSPLARFPYIARDHHQCFSTTQSLSRDHHFDTLKFVQRLKDEGFSEEQSKAMMLVLSDVIEESIQNLTRTMVLREGFQPSHLEHLSSRY